jgi:hypothetical protein
MKKLAKKYVKFLDEYFDKVESWSELVTIISEKFNVSVDYADKVIDAYIEY